MRKEPFKDIGVKYSDIVYNSSKKNFFAKHELSFNPPVKIFGKEIKQGDVLLTVMIPTFGRVELLERCLYSVLRQNVSFDFEVLIIDNNPDNLIDSPVLDIIKKCNDNRIIYYCNKTNLGPIGNWNNGFQIAHGKWVAMIHDDDFLHPDWLKSMYTAYKKIGEKADVISCCLKNIYSANDEVVFKENKITNLEAIKCQLKELKKGLVIPLLGAWIKKSFFAKIGGFGTDTIYIEDYIFMGNAIKNGNVYCLNIQLYGYWISDINASTEDNLWNAVIISEYFYRCQLLKECGYSNFYCKLYSKFKVCRNIIAHNHPRLKQCPFTNTFVKKYLIRKLCGIHFMEFYLIYWIAFLYSYIVFYIGVFKGRKNEINKNK